jgi:hypothetical protein
MRAVEDIMKSTLFIALLMASAAFGKDFNSVLLKDVQKDIVKDDQKYKQTKVTRGPASVVAEPIIQEESKLDKNLRQIGPKRW